MLAKRRVVSCCSDSSRTSNRLLRRQVLLRPLLHRQRGVAFDRTELAERRVALRRGP